MFKLPPLPRTLRACQQDLSCPDIKVRLAVVTDLARISEPSERAARIDLLVEALSDEESAVRRAALVSLADLEAREALSSIQRLLSDPEIQVRQMAVMALGEVAAPEDEAVHGRLASLLRAGNPAIRYQALLAHSSLKPDDAAEDLERACADEDEEVRELALRLIDELLVGHDRPLSDGLSRCVAVLCDDQSEHVALVAQLLAAELRISASRNMIESVVRREFRVREPRDEQSALHVAGELRMKSLIPALRKRAFGLWGFSFDPFRWVALSALAKLDERAAIDKLMRALSSGNYMERTLAAQGLSESAHLAALPLLEKMRGRDKLVDQEVLGVALKNLAGKSPGLP